MRVLFLLLTLAILTTEVRSQSTGGSTRSTSSSPIDHALFDFMEEHPTFPTETLYQDKLAIEASMPAIRHIFKKRGLSEYDAEVATIVGWRYLRIDNSSTQSALSPKDLINYVADLVRLTIKSNPVGASVEIDGKKLPRKTTTIAWCTPGKRRVRINKEGYQPVEDTCEVKRDEPTECEIKLIPVQKR